MSSAETVRYCGRCAGTGEYPPTSGYECSTCDGTGEYVAQIPAGRGSYRRVPPLAPPGKEAP